MEDLYGTWDWVAPVSGDGAAVRGQLILKSDGTYSLVEYGENTSFRKGSFGVYRAVGKDLDPWIDLSRAGAPEQRVFQFVGRDTLLLRQGDYGYAVTGSDVDLFVRAPADQGSAQISRRDRSYDEEPVPITKAQPKYPEFAREALIQGRVVLDVLVDEEGRVQQVKVLQGVAGLNEAAVVAVKQWTFKPAVKNGLPVSGWVEVPMDFHL